ncbi:MAG TPA: allantoinase AllB [Oceanospirillales bacterium]|nr:allantoinase AllB [Oceanospirillales bacterium]
MKAISSTQVFTDGKAQAAAVLYENGIILDIVSLDKIPENCEHNHYADLVIMPGLVDTHVHINEPGRTDWEGFNTATQAAAAGGITTVIDMPLNCIPVTTTLDAALEKQKHLSNQMWVDIGFHGGIIPHNENDIPAMVEAGIKTFKAFMIDSGVEEFPASDIETLTKAMPVLAQANATLLVHAELEKQVRKQVIHDKSSYKTFLNSRPEQWEVDAIREIIELSQKYNCKVHIVHLSSAKALKIIKQAQQKGIKITAETCPHYLTLDSESIPDGDARYKCCPPIRSSNNQDALWQGLLNGTIDFIVSDHSPCTPALKKLEQQNLWDAWGGISSLQFGLSLIWTKLKQKNIALTYLVKWMCENPAKLVGLEHFKGQIKKGYQADFVIWNPNKKHTIDKKEILHKNKLSAYEQHTVFGVIEKTILAGNVIFDKNKENFTDKPKGKYL